MHWTSKYLSGYVLFLAVQIVFSQRIIHYTTIDQHESKMHCASKYLSGYVLFLAVQIVFSQNGCPAGLTTEQELILNYDGNCYFFSNTALSYSQANNSCAQKEGFLAVIRDNATQIALSKHADLVSDIAESSSYWIGIKRENSTYTTTSLGESAEFLNFDSNSLSPVQTGQKGCARLDLTEDSKWIADDCARVFWDIGHICQYTGTSSAAYTKAGPGFIISILAVFLILQ